MSAKPLKIDASEAIDVAVGGEIGSFGENCVFFNETDKTVSIDAVRERAKREKLEKRRARAAARASLGLPAYTLGEEIANATTHGLGAVLSIAALVLLVVRAATRAPLGETAGYVVGYALFGASLLTLYLASTIYHSLYLPNAKRIFSVLDHSAIYILIAGTYSGYCLGPLYGGLGWWVFGTIWALAAIGIVSYAVYQNRARAFSFVLYLAMGWFVLLVAGRLRAILPPVSWTLLVVGGVSYTVGCVFFAMKRVRWMHSIWHLFVLAGSVLHFLSLYWAI